MAAEKAKTATAALQVKGMHCGSCEMLITDALTDMGVSDVKASHKEGSVKVAFNTGKVNLDEIKNAIEKEGYEVVGTDV